MEENSTSSKSIIQSKNPNIVVFCCPKCKCEFDVLISKSLEKQSCPDCSYSGKFRLMR